MATSVDTPVVVILPCVNGESTELIVAPTPTCTGSPAPSEPNIWKNRSLKMGVPVLNAVVFRLDKSLEITERACSSASRPESDVEKDDMFLLLITCGCGTRGRGRRGVLLYDLV